MPNIVDATTVLKAILDITDVQKNSKSYNSILSSMNSVTQTFIKSVSGMNVSGNLFSGLEESFKRIRDVTFSILVADTFRDIERAIGAVVDEAVAAVSVFQTMKIQFDTLAARDYARSFGVSVADALRATTGQAEQLIYWVRQLAVTTPFSVESVGRMLALSQAYGFSVVESKKLTESVGNFTAAMGLQDDTMRRIIYNMGQMVSQGKPTGRELRDLSNSFVPIGTIADRFAKSLGTSRAEILKMFSTGKIGAKQFVAEFVKMVDEDFPNAMVRMSRTFVAVQNNIQDLIQSLLGYEVLGPVADKIAGTLQDLLQSVLTPENYAIAGNLGDVLLFSYNRLAETVSRSVIPTINEFFSIIGISKPTTYDVAKIVMTLAANIKLLAENAAEGVRGFSGFIESTLGYFGTSLSDLADNMFQWGENVILSFASGIASGVGFIIEALTSVADTITYFLKAGSPPRLLPDLTLWGTEAMIAYMQGWKSADFSLFNDIGDLMTKAIQSWSSILTDVQIDQKIIATQNAIAKAVDQFSHFGSVTASVMNDIMNAAGFTVNGMREFVIKTMELTKVSGILAAVNSMLKFSGAGSVNIFGNTVSSFKQIGNMSSMFGGNLSGLISKYAADSIKLAASSLRLIAIDKKLTEAQSELNAVTKFYDDIITSLESHLNKLQDQQVDKNRIFEIDLAIGTKILTIREKERLENEKAQILLTRQIRDKQLEKDIAIQSIREKIDALNDQKKAYEDEKKALKDRVDFEIDQIKAIATANVDSAKLQVEALKQIIQNQIDANNNLNRLREAEKKAKEDAEKEAKKAKTANEDLLGSPGDLESYGVKAGISLAQGLQDGIMGKVGDIQKSMNDLWNMVLERAREFWGKLKAPFAPLTGLWDNLTSSFKDLLPRLSYSWNLIKDTLSRGVSELKKFWEEDGGRIAEAVGEVIGVIVTNLFITKPGEKSIIQILAEGFVTFGETLSENKEGILEMINSVRDFLKEDFFPMFKDFLTNLTQKAIPAIMDFIVKSFPPLMDFLGLIVKHAPEIIAVIGAIGLLQLGLGLVGAILISIPAAALSIIGVIAAINALTASPIVIAAVGFIGAFITDVITWIPILAPFLAIAVPQVALLGIAIGLLLFTIIEFGPRAWKTMQDIVLIIVAEWLTLKDRLDDSLLKFKENWDFLFGEKGGLRLVITGFFDWLLGEKGGLSAWIKGFFDAGVNLVKGLWEGILSAKDWIVTNMTNFWNGIVTTVKNILGEASPSKVFYDIGSNIMLGMYNGIRDNSYSPVSEIGRVMSSISNISNDNRTFITMNPTYENVQSPSSIYYDISAALATART